VSRATGKIWSRILVCHFGVGVHVLILFSRSSRNVTNWSSWYIDDALTEAFCHRAWSTHSLLLWYPAYISRRVSPYEQDLHHHCLTANIQVPASNVQHAMTESHSSLPVLLMLTIALLNQLRSISSLRRRHFSHLHGFEIICKYIIIMAKYYEGYVLAWMTVGPVDAWNEWMNEWEGKYLLTTNIPC
jgi:hypothetical protein